MKRRNVNDSATDELRSNKTAATGYPVNKDCMRYRARYPSLDDSAEMLDRNLRFYSNALRSFPSPGGTIEEILADWHGDFELLERHHGYIQWLFPLRVAGANDRLHPLQRHEMAAIRADDRMRTRVLRAYKLMLHFYGLALSDAATGQLVKLPDFHGRLMHVLRRPHNLLRITRIIRSLGELGWAHLQRPLVEVFVDTLLDGDALVQALRAAMRPKEIESALAVLRQSCASFWVNSILDDGEWRAMQERARPLL